ncbi:hypothetical protein LAWI1_G008557, partial [Lachnellula willkommii]
MSVQEKAPAQPNGETNGFEPSGTQNRDAEKQAPVQHNGDAAAQGEHKSKVTAAKEKVSKQQQKIKDKKDPPGGYDATPIPAARDGYTVRFTFHRAENLPVADLNSRSSDPFIMATLSSSLPKRHKEDPEMVIRTPTMHKNTNPEWNSHWIVAGIPSSGFRLKCRLYDEDATDHDDRLGNVTVHVNHIDANWKGFQEDKFDVKKRMGSKRAYLIRGCAAMFSDVHMSGSLYLSAELLDTDVPGGPPDSPPPKSPESYELVIDNDSGTYRPKGELLPKLKEFLNANFPGLHVVVKECTDEKLGKMKQGQRERKKREGGNVTMVQNSDDEISSSDEERLDGLGGGRAKKTGKQRALDALENPRGAVKDIIPGEKGRMNREANEEDGDRAKASG